MAGLLHYRVERGLFNAAASNWSARSCPVCGKDGAWVGECFVPKRDKDKPPCHCRAIHEAGAWAYDPETRTFVPLPGAERKESPPAP